MEQGLAFSPLVVHSKELIQRYPNPPLFTPMLQPLARYMGGHISKWRAFFLANFLDRLRSQSSVAQDFRNVAKHLPRKPTSILVITAHHETRDHLELVGDPGDGASPSLLYDYGGFPPETYELLYPGTNAPEELVHDVRSSITTTFQGLKVKSNNARGWDHGVFVPLILMFPHGLPTLSLSIRDTLDPVFHQKLGVALKTVRQRHPDCLIVASGSVTHGRQSSPGFVKEREFVNWFEEVLAKENAAERSDALRDAAKNAPHFQLCHPRAEHYIPLIVGAAAASDGAAKKIGGGWWHSLAVFLYLV